MGKLILCSGERTKRPYVFTTTGVRIYSIEELCYFLYHYVYLIDDSMFTDSLIDWIQTELKLSESAEKLRLLKSQKSDIKTMVTVIMCSCDYYSEQEIKNLIKVLDEIIGMPIFKRSYLKANKCLKNGQYHEAMMEYDHILNSQEVEEMTPEDYGDILHNQAVAILHISGITEAADTFRHAYELNHREESLRQYLYCLKLSNKEDLFYEMSDEYQVKEELQNLILAEMEQKLKETDNSKECSEIRELRQYKAQGRMSEYYKQTEEIIDSWKMQVRRI